MACENMRRIKRQQASSVAKNSGSGGIIESKHGISKIGKKHQYGGVATWRSSENITTRLIINSTASWRIEAA